MKALSRREALKGILASVAAVGASPALALVEAAPAPWTVIYFAGMPCPDFATRLYMARKIADSIQLAREKRVFEMLCTFQEFE